MCKSGFCPGGSRTQVGTCQSNTTAGKVCTNSDNCIGGLFCEWTDASRMETICCPNGTTGLLHTHYFCLGTAELGAGCFRDEMCISGLVCGNRSGPIMEGKCV